MFSCPCAKIYKKRSELIVLYFRMRLSGGRNGGRQIEERRRGTPYLLTYTDVTVKYTGSENSLRCTRFP